MRNPFDFSNMIRDPEGFYGRKDILGDIYSMLNILGKCSVVGPRRVGKSSLLYHITLPDVYSLYLDEPENYVFAFIDLQITAGLGVDDFLMMAIERLCRASRDRLEFSPEEYGNERDFPRFLEKACDENFKLVLCCDEFECLDPQNGFSCDYNFFTFLRGMLMGYSLTMVTSSQAHLPKLCCEGYLPSPLWNIFIEFPLGLMTEEEMLSLIKEPFARSGINLRKDEISLISDLAGPHPFFLQMACHYLFESKITQNSPDLSETKRQFIDNAIAHYDYAWGKLDDEQKEALKSLVEDGALPERAVLNKLKDDAIVTEKNQISSTGWKRFVEQKHDNTEFELGEGTIEVLCSYSHKDEYFRDEIEKHLSLLRRQRVIAIWHDRRIAAGTEWKGKIDKHLNTAQIILLLVSSDFLASDYCYNIEMKRAMERHKAGEARVIPIILRPVDWKGTPFSKLQALPKDAKAVSLWENQDEALKDIAESIRVAIEEIRAGS
jgi:hypothetical protein